MLKQRGLRYDPDLLVLNFVLNDIEGNIQFQGLSEQGEMSRISSQFLEPDADLQLIAPYWQGLPELQI